MYINSQNTAVYSGIYCCLILTTCFNPFIGPSSGLQLYKICWSLLLAVTPATVCIVSYK